MESNNDRSRYCDLVLGFLLCDNKDISSELSKQIKEIGNKIEMGLI